MALWAFGLGYLISSMIQVFVTEKRMKDAMGEAGARSMGLATFFGLISSSCSFAALSTTRALFTKGAGLIPSLAFLLASTNLVIELGIVISLFLSWQFVVGEYLGGVILILLMALVLKLTLKDSFEKKARERAKKQEGPEEESEKTESWKKKIKSKKGWTKVAKKYLMEWQMVWKDVTIGFTVAGLIASFVPKSFFQALFLGAGSENLGFGEVVLQSLIGPVAAFFTFIGSMGNIPLAAVLFSNGVSFAGIMAFIFSDLVVLPVLRIQAKYYGWKMALYILAVFLFILVTTSVIMHFGFSGFNMLPSGSAAKSVTDREFFKIDYTLFLNLVFIAMSAVCVWVKLKEDGVHMQGSEKTSEKILFTLSIVCFVWLGLGALL